MHPYIRQALYEHYNMFQPLKGYLQGIYLTHSNSKVNKMSHQT